MLFAEELDRTVTHRIGMIRLIALGLMFLHGLALVSIAQSPPQKGAITGIAHIAFRVSDVDRETAFFASLGFEQAFTNSTSGKTTQAFIKINDRQYIELYPRSAPDQVLGWMHVCYEVDDLNAFVVSTAARGLTLSPVRKAGAGNLLSVVNDPDGRVTEFTQYMPGSRHTLDKGLHLGPHRVSEKLIGFELPMSDLAAARVFYPPLGFAIEDDRGGLRLAAPSAALQIEILATTGDRKPRTLFAVPDVHKTITQVRGMGLKFDREKNRVIVNDPDGNILVLLEPSSK